VYLDPPFNTGRVQRRDTLSTVADADGERTGFAGRRYRSKLLRSLAYDDAFGDYLSFLAPRLERARELLAPHGTLYFHIDYREAHYCKLLLDEIFGRDAFLNELIWAYDYGAKPRRRWPAKHDTILVYVRTPGAHHFDADAVEREPYMAPGLVTAEKAARGKLPTSVWWHTIVSPTGREKTGYPTQKPEGIVRRMVQASTRPGDWCLDPFAGSGTLGAVAAKLVHPECNVVVVTGDGGFLMNSQELETARRLGTAFVIVIWENCQYGSIVWKQDKKFGRHFGTDFANPDFVKLAESFGLPAWRCESVADFSGHLRRALAEDLPSLIVLPIDYSLDVAISEELGTETVVT